MIITEKSFKRNKGKLSCIIINEITDEMKISIATNFSNIFLGDTYTKLELKEELKNRLYNVKGELKINHVTGFLSELLVHSFMLESGGTQYSVLRNLEDSGSFKKGFDALYKLQDILFFVESKSTVDLQKEDVIDQHTKNIEEARTYMHEKLIGNHRNNPWINAKGHAYMLAASTNIIDFIRKNSIIWSARDISKIEKQKKKMGFIPNSTIFTEGSDEISIDLDDLFNKINGVIDLSEYKSVIVTCFTKRTKMKLVEFLENEMFDLMED